MITRTLCVAFWTLISSTCLAEDWPHWLGPRADSTWNDTGLITSFPKTGPKISWRAPVGNGYSGPSVAAGRVYVMDYQIATGEVTVNPGGRSEVTGKERIVCFDEKSGKQIWAHAYDCPLNLSFPNGPRCSPVVDGSMVYSLGAEGHLAALDAITGKPVWEKELKKEYKCESPIWGFAATPLIHGDLLYTLAGGTGTAAVALHKKTGREVWRALDTKDIGYAPPVIHQRGGKDELIIWHSEALHGIDPLTGKVHWSQPFNAIYGMSIMAPRKVGDHFFIAGMGKKSMMVKPGDGTAEIVWEGMPNQSLGSKNGTPIIEGDYIYGCDLDGDLRCVQASTGKRMWTTLAVMSNKKLGSGTFFMARTPQQWVLFNDSGELILADISPKGYKEKARAAILEPITPSMGGRKVVWAHPAFANQCVFARNDKELICVSLAE